MMSEMIPVRRGNRDSLRHHIITLVHTAQKFFHCAYTLWHVLDTGLHHVFFIKKYKINCRIA